MWGFRGQSIARIECWNAEALKHKPNAILCVFVYTHNSIIGGGTGSSSTRTIGMAIRRIHENSTYVFFSPIHQQNSRARTKDTNRAPCYKCKEWNRHAHTGAKKAASNKQHHYLKFKLMIKHFGFSPQTQLIAGCAIPWFLNSNSMISLSLSLLLLRYTKL